MESQSQEVSSQPHFYNLTPATEAFVGWRPPSAILQKHPEAPAHPPDSVFPFF